MHAQRFWIERSFQDAKSELGLAQCEVRGWPGWHHHVTLACLALLFLLKGRCGARGHPPLLSARDIVELLAIYLPRRPHNEAEVLRQMPPRHATRQRDLDNRQRRLKAARRKLPKKTNKVELTPPVDAPASARYLRSDHSNFRGGTRTSVRALYLSSPSIDHGSNALALRPKHHTLRPLPFRRFAAISFFFPNPSLVTSPQPTLRSIALAAAVAALLALFGWLAYSASRTSSQTSDELPHLAAGFVFDRFGDFRMHPENGNLPQRLFGLPGILADARFPMDAERWAISKYWQLGWDYLYGLGNPTDRLIQQARALNIAVGAALGLLVFALARLHFGPTGGLLALAFYVLAPNILAHSALATSDVCAAFFLTLAPWLFWRHLEKRDLASGALAALASGLTLVAKFNGLLLAPIYALLLVADAFLRESKFENRKSKILARLAQNLALATLQGLAAVALIWVFFNFRFSARAPGTPELIQFSWTWEQLLPALGLKRLFVETALRWHLLPEAWLYGLTNVLAGESARPSFFAGEHGDTGWWQFFPTLFLTKTPLATLGAHLLALLAGAFALRRAAAPARRAALLAACPLLVTAAVVGFTALRSHLNIGDRHILALYPALFIALGLLATRSTLLAGALVLLAGQAAASFSARPHYLASFNSLIGGPAHAHRLVVDSSLDWGQDLPTLRAWLDAHRRPDEKFFLGYFGSAWPPHYGVRPTHFLPAVSYIVRPPHTPYELTPGLYAVSATLLSEVYSSDRGPWTPAMEARWQRFRTTPPTAENFPTYDHLRFTRLCKYLQLRAPEADAGHSILIYRLTPTDLRAALESPVTGAYRLRPD